MTRRLALVLAVLGVLVSLTPAQATTRVAAHLSAPEAVVGGATAVVAGAPYGFSSLVGGKPVRWDPCTTIHWQFRAAGAPAGGLTVAKQAVARIAQVTGTRWVYDGTTATVPTSRVLPTKATAARPVLIGWADAASSDLLRSQPKGVLGVTRTAWFGWTKDGTSTAAIRAAVVALDRTDRLPLTGSVSWKAVLLHELAHGMGMDHAGSTRQLMYPVLQRGLTDLQSGDVAGLVKLGRSAGCITLPF